MADELLLRFQAQEPRIGAGRDDQGPRWSSFPSTTRAMGLDFKMAPAGVALEKGTLNFSAC